MSKSATFVEELFNQRYTLLVEVYEQLVVLVLKCTKFVFPNNVINQSTYVSVIWRIQVHDKILLRKSRNREQ